MKSKKRVFLIDFDNTLFNTERLKVSIDKRLVKKFGQENTEILWKIYATSSKELGYVNIKDISLKATKKLKINSTKEIEDIFLKAKFDKFLFKHTPAIIDLLKKKGKVILYSLGDTIYQPLKIKGSGAENLIGKKNIIVAENKIDKISSIILELKSKGFEEIFLIDDRSDFLEKAKEVDPNTTTIWFKYGKYKEVLPKNNLSIDYEAKSAESLHNYLLNFIGKITQNSMQDNISILKDISKSQISQIVSFTKKDNQIKKFTRDRERFYSYKSFISWKRRDKQIYTLCGNNENILGIIWFSGTKPPKTIKENLSKYSSVFTFAIRLYRPARHKGLAAKFMDETFRDFLQNHKRAIWLSTTKDNQPAVSLYERFGFEKIKEAKDGQIYYLYI